MIARGVNSSGIMTRDAPDENMIHSWDAANLKPSKTFSYQLKILNKVIFTQIISI